MRASFSLSTPKTIYPKPNQEHPPVPSTPADAIPLKVKDKGPAFIAGSCLSEKQAL
jgi:hypothetical protein